MSRRSIRFELTFWYSLIMALTLLIVGVAIERLAYNRISASIDNSLRQGAYAIINEVALLKGDVGAAMADTQGTSLNPPPWPPRYVQLLDTNMAVVYRSRNLGAFQLPVDTLLLRRLRSGMVIAPDMKLLDRERFRVITFRMRPVKGSPIGWGQVALSLHDLDRAKRKNRLALAFIIPGAIVISAVLGRWLATRALQPIEQVNRTARHIGATNLHERLAPRPVEDEVGRLIDTLNDLFERLEQNFIQINRFSADVSHELRTPLTIIQGEAEVALKPTAAPEEMRQALEVIVDEARRMSQLVRNLLMLARLESGQQRPQLTRLSLRPIVEDLAEEARYMASTKGLTLELGRIDDAEVLGDAVLLHQLGFNLIDNAVKYTPPGGVVALSLEVAATTARLSVRDTGTGIEPGELEFIFERFYRSARTRPLGEGGSGLGLSLVKQILEIHRGSVQVTSKPGEGSRFVIILPLERISRAGRREAGSSPIGERALS